MPTLSVFEWIGIAILFFASVAFYLDTLCKRVFPHTRISASKRRIPKLKSGKLISLFFVNSIQTGLLIAAVFELNRRGFGGLYRMGLDSFGSFGLMVLQFFLLLVVYDSHYYWGHRLFHTNKAPYRWVHAEHHEARYPNVWHLHYQNPLEWFLTTTSPMLLVAVLPLPISVEAYLLSIAVALFVNVGGHAGHEITGTFLGMTTLNGWMAYIDPKRKHIARLFNNVLHHDLHHQRVVVNYSLYFTWWDRLAGSMDHDTDMVEKFVSQKKISNS